MSQGLVSGWQWPTSPDQYCKTAATSAASRLATMCFCKSIYKSISTL